MEQTVLRQQQKFVGVVEAPALTVSTIENAELKATRVRWENSGVELPTECERADGYVIYLLRRELPSHPAWIDEHSAPLGTIQQGQFLLLDLRAQHSALVRGNVDCVSIYTASDTLQRYQSEHDLPATGLLHAPHSVIYDDHVIRHLGEALLPAIERPQAATELYASHVALALLSRLTERYAAEPRLIAQLRGGLAPWQERRAKDMLIANLDGGIGLEALAAECGLSRSHFARAFKTSTGISPLRWLARQRIDRAKILLQTTEFSLEEIADRCGFSDASHLARTFRHATGLRPGDWRRLRRFSLPVRNQHYGSIDGTLNHGGGIACAVNPRP
jgi:AraC-like DNA-binding protein